MNAWGSGACLISIKQFIEMKNPYRKINKAKFSLGDLVAVVGSCAKDSKETVAAVADLIATGRVSVCDHGTRKALKLASS